MNPDCSAGRARASYAKAASWVQQPGLIQSHSPCFCLSSTVLSHKGKRLQTKKQTKSEFSCWTS